MNENAQKQWYDIIEGQSVGSVEELDRLFTEKLERMLLEPVSSAKEANLRKQWCQQLKAACSMVKRHGHHSLGLLGGCLEPYIRCLKELEAEGKFQYEKMPYKRRRA